MTAGKGKTPKNISETIWRNAKRINGTEQIDDSTRCIAMLLASAVVGANVRRICRLIGLDEAMARVWRDNLRSNDVWRGGKVAGSEWFGKNGGIALCLDANVAMGLMRRTRRAGGKS